MMVHFLSIHVDNVLLARSASKWSQMSFAKHCVIYVIIAHTLFGKEFHNFSYLFAQLCEPLHDVFLVGKLVENLLYHVSQLLHDSVFKVFKIRLISL